MEEAGLANLLITGGPLISPVRRLTPPMYGTRVKGHSASAVQGQVLHGPLLDHLPKGRPVTKIEFQEITLRERWPGFRNQRLRSYTQDARDLPDVIHRQGAGER